MATPGFKTRYEGSQAPAGGSGEASPTLRPGDRLEVAEFERRYRALPEVKKAELIDGVVFMPSPVSDDFHGMPHVDLQTILGLYRFHTPGVRAGDNSTIRVPEGRTQLQPDCLLRIDPACGGRTRTDPEGYVVGGPELVAEITHTSANYDLNEKKAAYRNLGVPEYLVWRVVEESLDWFVLRGGDYDRLKSDDLGIHRSEVFPGLWIDGSALLGRDFPKLLEVLHEGLNSSAHAAFIDELAGKREAGS